MGKKAEPLTWRERYIATKIGCMKKDQRYELPEQEQQKWHRYGYKTVDKSPAEIRRILKYREENNPRVYAEFVKIWEDLQTAKFNSFRDVQEFSGRISCAQYQQGDLIGNYVEAKMSIKDLSEEEIARKMVLEAGNED